MKQVIIRTIITVVGIFLIINLLRSTVDLWQKGSLLDKEEERFAKAKLENEQLQNEYNKVQSPEFIEKQARDKLNLGKEGEVAVILPPKQGEAKPKEEIKPIELPVWKQWVGYLLDR